MAEASSWIKDEQAKEIHSKLEWNRPENARYAGKLLIISGQHNEFATAANMQSQAYSAGAGAVRILLPDNLKRIIPAAISEDIHFLPSVKQGSFAQVSLAELLEHAAWADCVLLPGGLGKNSETTLVIEKFIEKYTGLLVISGDTLDFTLDLKPELILGRKNTIVIGSFQQTQKALTEVPGNTSALTHDLPVERVVTILQNTTKETPVVLTTHREGVNYIAHNGLVCTLKKNINDFTGETPARLSVWAMQNSAELFNAVVASVF